LLYIYFSESEPVEVGTMMKLGPALQTTAIQRLTIGDIQNEDFKILLKYLPKTLTTLNMNQNLLKEDNLPILRSYIQSNECTLKKLILNTSSIASHFEEHGLLPLKNIKISENESWNVEFFDEKVLYYLNPIHMSDSEWSDLFTALTEKMKQFLVKYI
jgi:hypothetical protein